MKKYIFLWGLIFLTLSSSCNYLDVVPDDIPTVAHAFDNRYQAEGFLYGCYGFLPLHFSPNSNPAMLGGDEIWLFEGVSTGVMNPQMWGIARGEQGTDTPIANFWASKQDSYDVKGGNRLFTAIRDCNILMENIDIPTDMDEEEKLRWVGEAKFLKAYYHFWLFRMYGPIPIIKENLPISADSEEAQVYREPIDSVANYIVQLLDEAIEVLPLQILDITNEMGRATKPIAAALKAEVLTYVASPLFNGNPEYADVTDNRGVHLFPQDYRPEKWQRAADALRDAIAFCDLAGHLLYDFRTSGVTATLNEATINAMQTRGAVTERWNPEIIWGEAPRGDFTNILQRISFPAFSDYHQAGHLNLCYAPTLQVVEQFYSKNGIPIEHDSEWEGVDWYGLKTADASQKFYVAEGFETINLHFNREARFYGAISFDGGMFYGNGAVQDNAMSYTKFKYGANGRFLAERHSSTGYLVKKILHRLTSITTTSSEPTYTPYAFPIIRLAGLYLMYAEALNEVKAAPDAEVYEYIDLVRKRSGLDGVVDSWWNHGIESVKNKPLTQEGMREIIHRERLNELAFEGQRFWDLKRWKEAEKYMNRPIRGLNKLGESAATFYVPQVLYEPTYSLKDYLWPLRQGNLLKNRNLIQNPGWEIGQNEN
ncbi:MAG: RagB/SusD family nutrient uptake outer membrane protein [Tannerella sp.]|jgi:hypothetical protein|nr:RagB/SusD family nutrient uptake outer membrane protein [Tannerella sp.]